MSDTVTDLFNKIKIENSIISINKEVIPEFNLKIDDYKAKFARFNETKFIGLFILDDVSLSIGMFFENCIFKESVTFKNIKSHGYDNTLHSSSQNLVFRNCKFLNTVNFNGDQTLIEREILFESCEFEKGLEISHLNITKESLTLRSCVIKEKLFFSNALIEQNIQFDGNNIICSIRLDNINCSSLIIIKENIFSNNIHIHNCKIEKGIIFNYGIFKKEIYITLVETKDSGLSIIGSIFEEAIFVQHHYKNDKPSHGILEYFFRDVKFNNGIYINGTDDLFAEYPFVNKIEMDISTELKGDIVFRNLDVGIFTISGYNSSTNIIIQDVFINQIKIKGLINNSGLVLSRVKASFSKWSHKEKPAHKRSNAIYIDDSNFGKAQFFQVDFSSFEIINFHNIILTDISTSLTKWFTPKQLDDNLESHYLKQLKDKNEKIRHGAISSLVSDYNSKKEIYRQLKYIAQKQGDKAQAMEFQRHEMNYYRKSVSLKTPRNWSEHLILWSNQTNNFGQSWIKAFCLFILFSFIAYVPIGFLNTSELDYSKFATNGSEIFLNLKIILWDNLKNWIVIMNPTHSFKDINENTLSSWIYFWDLLSRIIVSYFIFQIISAFRKFNS